MDIYAGTICTHFYIALMQLSCMCKQNFVCITVLSLQFKFFLHQMCACYLGACGGGFTKPPVKFGLTTDTKYT